MIDTQTVDNIPAKLPTVEQFRSVVIGELNTWGQATVDRLCFSQTRTVIEGLAPYYHSGEDDTVPDVDTFRQVIRQAQKERPAFVDLTEPEVNELITALAPHFHHPF